MSSMNRTVEPVDINKLRVSAGNLAYAEENGVHIIQPTRVAQAVHYALYGDSLPVLMVNKQ